MNKKCLVFFLVKPVNEHDLEDLGIDVSDIIEEMEADGIASTTMRTDHGTLIAEDMNIDFGGTGLKDLFYPGEPVGYDEDYYSDPVEDENEEEENEE